jgi:hypothetical protein
MIPCHAQTGQPMKSGMSVFLTATIAERAKPSNSKVEARSGTPTAMDSAEAENVQRSGPREALGSCVVNPQVMGVISKPFPLTKPEPKTATAPLMPGVPVCAVIAEETSWKVNPPTDQKLLIGVLVLKLQGAVKVAAVPAAMEEKAPLPAPGTYALTQLVTAVAVAAEDVSRVSAPANPMFPVIGTAWTVPANAIASARPPANLIFVFILLLFVVVTASGRLPSLRWRGLLQALCRGEGVEFSLKKAGFPERAGEKVNQRRQCSCKLHLDGNAGICKLHEKSHSRQSELLLGQPKGELSVNKFSAKNLQLRFIIPMEAEMDHMNSASLATGEVVVTLDCDQVAVPSGRRSLSSIRSHLETLALARQRVLAEFSVDGAPVDLALPMETLSFRRIDAVTIPLEEFPLLVLVTAARQVARVRAAVESSLTLVLINNPANARELWWNIAAQIKEPVLTLSLMPENYCRHCCGTTFDKLRRWQLEQIALIIRRVDGHCDGPDNIALSDALEKLVVPWLDVLSQHISLWHEAAEAGTRLGIRISPA